MLRRGVTEQERIGYGYWAANQIAMALEQRLTEHKKPYVNDVLVITKFLPTCYSGRICFWYWTEPTNQKHSQRVQGLLRNDNAIRKSHCKISLDWQLH